MHFHRQRRRLRLQFDVKMNRPFASFEFLNRGWDIRVLESQSLRSTFVVLLLDMFMLGMVTFMMIYEGFRLHRFNWSNAILFLVFLLPAFRYSLLIYRRLGR
jgi:hypothetical protein